MDPSNCEKNYKNEQFAIYEKNTTFMYRPPEMCDTFSNYKVTEKVDIWMLGCIFYTLMYKKHPFFEAQKLTIINTQYFTPEINYPDKLLDFMRLMLTPNPEKRPDIKMVIQIIQNWENINKIDLPKDVLELKAKHLENNRKSNKFNELLSEEEIMSIQKKIKEEEEKKRKKNPYKYKEDNNDINEIFGDFADNTETKINAQQSAPNQSKIIQKQSNQQEGFDPFNNNAILNSNKNNDNNWMIYFGDNSNNNNNSHKSNVPSKNKKR